MSTVGDLITWICIAIALWYVPRYLWRVYRGKNMSSPPPVRSTTEPVRVVPRTSTVDLVRALSYQAEPEPVRKNGLVVDLATLPNMEPLNLADLLAVQRDEDGEYRYSANKIAEFVGGTRADVLARIASHRPKPPAKKTEAHLDRPANGWGKG